ncbi:MAG: SoxXA-binding protein [Gammaproteobacteria bacterium]|nr:SoxXA-binding protein [Gammaproteobacteria bacterium]
MKKSLILAAAMLALGGCATSPDPSTVIAEAENEIKVAKKMNYLWRDTEKHLEGAKKAQADGDNEKANKLAKKALSEAKLAQQQAKDNAGAGPNFN